MIILRKSSVTHLRESVSEFALSNYALNAVRRFVRLLVSSTLVITPVTVLAAELPTGGNVVSGSATINQNGANQLLINQTSQNAILNFDTFSISKDGHVHFSNGTGSTLNRVTGGHQSRIDGRLSASGSLLLINTNGVIVGRNGTIDTGGSFLASTRDITNEDYLNGGDNTFLGNSDASVVNLGRISSLGGDITLIAHKVVNDGTLEAKNGNVGLASGIEVLLRDNNHADGRILVKAGKSGGSVTHSGAIKAANAELRAHSGHVYALAQNRKGSIQITGVKKSGGRVFLTATGGKVVSNQRISAKRRVVNKTTQKTTYDGGQVFINADIVNVAGLIDVSGQTGGAINIGAKDAITLDNATLDASGINDGGLIRVGGEFQGGRGLAIDEVQNTDKLLITETTLLDASSENSNGGEVIAWSDGDTIFNGTILVNGGGASGNGGLAETSGAERLSVGTNAFVSALSPNGAVGDWLLDPTNLIIEATGSGTLPPAGAGDFSVAASAINNAAANVTLQATDTITFDQAISMVNAGVGLNAIAGNLMTVNAAITTNDGDVNLTTDNISINAGIDVGTGRVTLAQNTAGREIDLGTETSSKFSLTDVEIDLIKAGTLQIGNASSGTITATTKIDPAQANTLVLQTAGSINTTVRGFDYEVENLVLRAGTGIENIAPVTSNLAYENGAGEVRITNFSSTGLTIASLDGLTSSSNSGTTTEISNIFGNLNVDTDVSSTGSAIFGLANGRIINVSKGVVISSNDELHVAARTVNLDGDLKATNGIEGTSTTVNVVSSTGGAEIQDAIDIGHDNANINIALGTYDSFVAHTEGQTISGVGTDTIIETGSPAVTVVASNVTIQNMLLQDTVGPIASDDHGILLDGNTSPGLTGITIQNVDFDNLEDGIVAQGVIGDGDTSTVDVRIRNSRMTNINSDGIRFDDNLNDANILIGGALPADGNSIVAQDDAVRTERLTDSIFTVANNVLLESEDNDGIDISQRVSRSNVNIVGNGDIIGADNGIEIESEVRGNSSINIAGNDLIQGENENGIIFEDEIRNSSVVIGSATVNVDGTDLNFLGNEQIIGDLRGIDSIDMRNSTFDVTDNDLIVGGEDGIILGLIRNSTVDVDGNGLILAAGIGSGIQIDGNIRNGSNIFIRNNGGIGGLGAGIFIGDFADIGNTDVNDSNITISGNTGVGGVLGGIMFASEIENDSNVEISDNDFTLGGLFGIDFISDISDSNVEITDNGAIGALGTGIQLGSILNPGSTVLQNSTFTIARNDAVVGLTGSGFNATSVLDGSTLRIVNNGIIRGGEDGIRTDELIIDSNVSIIRNDEIEGEDGDGIHIDGPTFQSTVRINTNDTIIGGDDGIDMAIIDDSDVLIRGNQLIEGTEHGIEFDDSFRAGSIIGGSNVRIVGNDHVNARFSDAIVVKSDIRGQSQFSVLRNNEITGGGNGILFAGDIRNRAFVRISENGTAELNGQSYDPNNIVNDTFSTNRFVSGVEGSAVAFSGNIENRARLNINRNMLGDSYDGITFFGNVTSSRTQRINNNFILENSNNGISFGSDFSQEFTIISSPFEVFQNYIIENRNSGVFVGGQTDVGSGINIHQNFIPGSGFQWGNQNFAINNQGSGAPNIDGNWWGTADAANIALTLSGVPTPTNFLASGADTNIELPLGASNYDPFAFQAGVEVPVVPVDPDDPVIPSIDTNDPEFANVSCEISLDERDLRDPNNLANLENLENRIEARCTEDPEEIGEFTLLFRN